MSNIEPTDMSFPLRLHFIPEWAKSKKMKQTDVANAVGADKGMVSRWFSGVLPQDKWLLIIAAAFGTDYHGLFRHPDEQWMVDFMKAKTPIEQQKIRQMLALMFDKPAAVEG